MDYNSFHRKNKRVQSRIISDNDYTYQSLIYLSGKYFDKYGKVLDIGCGVGTIDFYLSKKGHEVFGIDISTRAIKMANKSKKELGIRNVWFRSISVEDFKDQENYDFIICSEVMEHLEHPLHVMDLIKKKLVKGGVCILSVPSSNAPLYRLGFLRKFDNEVGHLRRYNKVELKNILEKYGFRILEIYPTEGVLRNLMYTTKFFGFFVRFVRYPLTMVVNFIDKMLVRMLGESNIYVVFTRT